MEAFLEQKKNIIDILQDHPFLIGLFFLSLVIIVFLIAAWKQPKILVAFSRLGEFFKRKALPEKCREHEAGIKEIKKLLYEDVNDRKKRQKEMDVWMDGVDKSLCRIIDRQDRQDKYIKSVSIGTLETMLDNKEALIQNRLKAFIRLIGLERNSYNILKGYRLITENRDDFEYVYNEFYKNGFEDIEIINREYFKYIMTEISTVYFSKRLKCNIRGGEK